jgi:uracil-DNA glycosylase
MRLKALELTPLDQVKVVILGQDPYHGPGQAHGLCFSVPDGVPVPPSLVNIYKELESDLGIARRPTGNLEHWARQGVLLLNNSLTVEAGRAGSHAGKGWEAITDAAVAAVAARESPSVFILWGSHARKKAANVPRLQSNGAPLVLTSPHPSPLSAYSGFFGSRPFSQANAFLDGQRIVEQQHALPRPVLEVAVHAPRHPEVALELLVDVDQRRRHLHPVGHREAQPVRLPRPVVRVLPEDDDLDLIERGQLERAQPLAARRVDRPPVGLLLLQPAAEAATFRRREDRLERRPPAFRNCLTTRHAIGPVTLNLVQGHCATHAEP